MPHTTTGISPAEMLFGRRPRSTLDLVIPDIITRVQKKQASHKASHDKRAKQRSFNVGDQVYIRNFTEGGSWILGKIVKSLSLLSFLIELEDGRTVRRHIDHIRVRRMTTTSVPDSDSDFLDLPHVQQPASSEDDADAQEPPPMLCRSTRVSKPPDRFTPSFD